MREWMQQNDDTKREKSVEDGTKTGIRPEVLEEIRTFARRHKVQKVILFGSRARGDYERASDIDLAVFGGDILKFTLDVKEKTSTLLDFDVVDLGQTLKDAFVKSISKEGILLYEEV